MIQYIKSTAYCVNAVKRNKVCEKRQEKGEKKDDRRQQSFP